MRNEHRVGLKLVPTFWGHLAILEKPIPVGGSHGYQHLMLCRYSSVSGGFGVLVPSDRAVICGAKLLRSYLLADFINQ